MSYDANEMTIAAHIYSAVRDEMLTRSATALRTPVLGDAPTSDIGEIHARQKAHLDVAASELSGQDWREFIDAVQQRALAAFPDVSGRPHFTVRLAIWADGERGRI